MSTARVRTPRNRPCEECREHRRKCTVQLGESRCSRCIKQGLECVFKIYRPSKTQNKEGDDQSVLDIQNNVEYLENQVYELEIALQEARASLNISPIDSSAQQEQIPFFQSPPQPQSFPSLNNPYISPQSTYDDMLDDYGSSFDMSINDGDSHSSVIPSRSGSADCHSYSTLSNITETSASTSHDSQAVQDLVLFSPPSSCDEDGKEKKQKSWSIAMTKQGLTINTYVKSVQDLVSWGLEAIKVLNLDAEIRAFPVNLAEYSGNINLPVTHKLLGFHKLFGNILRDHRRTLKFDTGVPPQPPVLAADPYKVVSNLIGTYFQCHNKEMYNIYQPTFMEKYYNNRDVFSSPVVMSICAFVCLRHCRHMPSYTSQELREFGEYFYFLSRELLEDIFDDPEHRQESIYTLIFIGMFRLMTLRVSEAFTAFSLAYTITMDLYDDQKDIPVVDEKSLIEREVFKRQCFHICVLEHHVYHLCEESIKEFHIPFLMEPLQILPGEGPDVEKIIKLKNLFTAWISNVHVINARREIMELEILEGPGSLSLQKYFKYEEMMVQLWSTLPPDFKIVEHPDMELTDDAVINADRAQLQSIILVHSWYIVLNALFLPKKIFERDREEEGTTPSAGQTEFTNMFVQSISARALDRCLRSSSIVITLAEQHISHNICRFEPFYILLVIDLSMRLAKAERRPDIARIGRDQLERCVNLLKASMFAPMHGVLLEEGRAHRDPKFEPPITRSLKEQIEKMLIPFGLSV